jgi:hypothetical protein
MRTIHIAATGHTVRLGAYVAAIGKAKANPDAMFRYGLTTWWPVTGADIRRQFMDGVNDRINRHLAGYGKGRKWSPDWQREAIQTAGRINTPRLAIDWLPQDFKARFAHRLRDRADAW